MQRVFSGVLRVTVFAIIVIAVELMFRPVESFVKYVNFTRLSKATLLREADDYVRRVGQGKHIACFYTVRCDQKQARLELVAGFDAWDLAAAKRMIWRRRFEDFCSGRAVNFGLELIPIANAEPLFEGDALAVWSFSGDGFIKTWRRWDGSTFSDQPWERCTPGRAIIRPPLPPTSESPLSPPKPP